MLQPILQQQTDATWFCSNRYHMLLLLLLLLLWAPQRQQKGVVGYQ